MNDFVLVRVGHGSTHVLKHTHESKEVPPIDTFVPRAVTTQVVYMLDVGIKG